MSWMLPPPMVFVAGLVVLVLLPSLVRRPVSLPRLALETCLGLLGAILLRWACWVVLWLIEQRW